MELRDYVRLVKGDWRLIAAITLAAVIVGVVVAAMSERVYAATAQVFVSPTGSSRESAQENANRLRSMMTSYAAAADSPAVLEPVRQKLALTVSAEKLGENVTTTVLVDTTVIDVTVLAATPEGAAAIANAIVDGLPVAFAKLDPAIVEGLSASKVTVIKRAVPRREPVTPAPQRDIGVALVLGLMSGFGAAYVRGGGTAASPPPRPRASVNRSTR